MDRKRSLNVSQPLLYVSLESVLRMAITSDEIWWKALDQAWSSFGEGNAGIGAVVVASCGTLFLGRSRTICDSGDSLSGSPIAHAEIDALRKVRGRAANQGQLFSTLQPCLMCTGATLMAQLAEVTFLARDPAWPSCAAMTKSTQWRQGNCDFQHENRRESTLALLLPLTTFAEKLSMTEFAIYRADSPAIADAAESFAHNGRLREMAAEVPFDEAMRSRLMAEIEAI